LTVAVQPQIGFIAPNESASRGRIDGRLKVTGDMPYAADLQVEGALHVAVVRSPHPHARILSIETAEARAVPGVRCILTGADVGSIRAGRALRDVPILAVGKARFAGEMVAAVAAETPEAADQAAGLIQVSYEPLPAVFDVEQAIRPDAVVVHDDPGSYSGAVWKAGEPLNLLARTQWKCGPDVEQALAASDRVFEHTFRTPKVHQGYIEPHCCTVLFDPQGKVRVWSCNKAPYRLREYLAKTFDLAAEDIEAETTAIGGDFGGKGAPMDIPLCLELSRRTGQPVRMLRTYVEELIAGDPRHSSVATIRMGVSHDGRLQAMDARILFNSGAYGGFRPSANFRSACGTSYRIPSARVDCVRVYTNEVPCGNMRAPGAPQTTFAVEAMMDFVAREMGIDPVEFRRRNLLINGEPTVMNIVWPEVRGHETLQAAEKAMPPLPASGPANLRYGRGVAVYDRPTHQPQRTSLRLSLVEGGAIEAQVPIMETGTGSHTMLQNVLATALGLDRERFVMRYVGTSHLPWDSGVGGSRVTISAAEAGVVTAEKFQHELAAAAASRLGVGVDQIEVSGGRCRDRHSGREVDLLELAANGVKIEAVGEVAESAESEEGATSYVVQMAQVAVDVETGEVQILDFVSAHDVAEILDPVSHRGQIEGGISMGIGMALAEDLNVVDGIVNAAHLGEYKLRTIADMPPLHVVLLPGGKGVGARNIKSIGEMGNVPAAAAVANAVSNALGVCMDSLPLTAEKVLAAARRLS